MRIEGYAMADLQEARRRALRPNATQEDVEGFREALCALDRQVTAGKLPPLPQPSMVHALSGLLRLWDDREYDWAPEVEAGHAALRSEDALPEGADGVRDRPLEPEAEEPTYRCTLAWCSRRGNNSGTWYPGCCQIREPQLVPEGEVG